MSSSSWAEYGHMLMQAGSPEEREQAAHIVDALFAGDSAGRQAFTDQWMEPSFGRTRSSQVATTSTAIDSGANIDPIPSPATPSGLLPNQLKDNVSKLVPIINANPAQQSPLLALDEKVKALFHYGPGTAAVIFFTIQRHIVGKTYGMADGKIHIGISTDDVAEFTNQDRAYLWKSCKMASTLILLLASPSDPACLHSALKSHSHALGGLPSHDTIKKTPSARLLLAFQRAKTAALDHGKTTALSIYLTDVHIFELAERGAAQPYFSFAHAFTMGIGPEGVIIWQSWGKHGYRLDEYMSNGHARIRNWSEADQFVRDFEKLAAQKGTWDAKCNKLYKKLFHIDINRICGTSGVERPVTPKFKAWVRLQTIENVTYGDVSKFSWS